MRGPPPPSRDIIARGIKRFSLVGAVVFVGLRAVDIMVQYNILRGQGVQVVFPVLGVTPSERAEVHGSDFAVLDSLNLSLPHLVILGLSVGAALKQSYWVLFICQEEFRPPIAVLVGVYNCVVSSINSLLFMAEATSSLAAPRCGLPVPYTVAVGMLLYAAGLSIEAVSEQQRKAFKANPANRDKVMRSGMWGWARHINYGGYVLWRGGYGLAASGWMAAVIWGGLMAYHFVTRSVPLLDLYCSSRYGEQWKKFKRDVRWTLLPGVY